MSYQVDVITLFPEMFKAMTEDGVIARAIKNKLIDFRLWNPRDYSTDKHQTVDDRPYGGGPGMVMKYEPLTRAISEAKKLQPEASVIYLSPQGRKLDQKGAMELSKRQGMIMVAGRYEGIDERVLQNHIDEEWSIGDYVLSGGELAAMVVIDSACRFLPGVLGHDESANQDSFVDGLLDYPHYTRPDEVDGYRVPEVLLNGNHQDIRSWRFKQALIKTRRVRPDLIADMKLSEEEESMLQESLEGSGSKNI